MTTIIRRAARRRRGPVRLLALVVVLALGGITMLAWQRGGPQPVREVAIALPDPVPAAEPRP